MAWYRKTVDEALKDLDSSFAGLISEEARIRLSKYGRNEIKRLKKRTAFEMFYGANYALALKKADIGIAMDLSRTDVSKETSRTTTPHGMCMDTLDHFRIGKTTSRGQHP